MSDVSVILNCFKRPDTLKLQIEALKNQTVKPTNIFIWQNRGNLDQFEPINKDIQYGHVSCISNYNFGVWSRFSFALNCPSKYICVFDDDTIPQPRWLENCIESNKIKRGLYGAIGVIFNDLNYSNYIRHGWANPNEEIVQVDIVGHSWFFERELLGAFWFEAPIPLHPLSGEDVHFSYAIQKYLGLNTYVPPHPVANTDLWGSLPENSYKFGIDEVAISANYHGSHFGRNLQYYFTKGFKYLNI